MRAWNRKRKPKFTTKTKHVYNDLLDKYVFYVRHMKKQGVLKRVDCGWKIIRQPAYALAGRYFKRAGKCNV